MEFNRKLILENGRVFYGVSFGAKKEVICEMVFNTCVVGYQELVSDLSYTDQALVMSYPLIGNYGIADEDFESKSPALGALIVREYNDQPSNFRSTRTLGEYLEEHDIPGVSEVDTRALVRILRDEGSQKVIITDADADEAEALKKLADWQPATDAVARVSCKKRWYARTANPKFQVVALDCGIQLGYVRKLNEKGCNVTVVPYNTSAEEILAMKPDGLFLSDGPGNPADLPEVEALIGSLVGKLPIFGMGLGHLLLCRACGAKTAKMKFGHRGSNHPVRSLVNGTVAVMNQSHGYVVERDSLADTCLTLTYENLLDNSCEGVASEKENCFSVQFHPLAEGPAGSEDLFETFRQMMEKKGE